MQTSVGPFFYLIAKIHVLQGKHMEKRHQPHDQVIGLLDEPLRNSDRGFAVLPLFEIVQQGTASRVRPTSAMSCERFLYASTRALMGRSPEGCDLRSSIIERSPSRAAAVAACEDIWTSSASSPSAHLAKSTISR